MKLYDLQRGSQILLPIHDGKEDGEVTLEMCTFNNIDGAYSRITTPQGDTVHLSASAELVEVSGHYELPKEAPNE